MTKTKGRKYMQPLHKSIIWGTLVALWLAFGLEPTGWLFYEASHGLGVDWLYWGYTAFRGGGYALSLLDYAWLVYLLVGAVIAALVYWRSARREAQA
jgi:hypothetical protein